jgi:hypothetical protein
MSLALLERVSGAITAAGLHTGYAIKYFRWTDADVAGTAPFMLFRRPGTGGDSNTLVQAQDVMIQLVATPTTVVAGDERMQAILKLLRQPTTQAGVVRFMPLGAVRGPLYLENGRPVWELNVRVVTEDQ